MEEYINLLELEENLKKNKISRFVNNKTNIAHFTSIIAAESVCVMNDFNLPYTIIINLLVPILLRNLYKSWKQQDDIIDIIVKEIRQTSDYENCIKLYDEYIKRLAELIAAFNFKSAKEVVFYFDTLLTHGFLSSNFKNVYHSFEIDRNYIGETFGARVLSGKSVCRHTACLAADCLNALGYKAEMLSVKSTEDINNFTQIKDLKKIIWNHGVVGIEEKSAKFLYDTTCSRLLGKSDIASEELKEYIAKKTFSNNKTHYLISPNQHSYSKTHNNLEKLMQLPLEKLDEDELFDLRKRILELFEINQGLAFNFAIKNISLTKEIAELESVICPHSDSKITSWSLKK